MSTIIGTTLQDRETSKNVTIATWLNTRVKAWVTWEYAGGVPNIYQAMNVSSLTDNGVGSTTSNFSTPFVGRAISAFIAYTWHHYSTPTSASTTQTFTFDGSPTPQAQDGPGNNLISTGYLA